MAATPIISKIDEKTNVNNTKIVPKLELNQNKANISASYSNIVNKHKRVGSTGTTGDESYTTDDEEQDETDASIKDSYEHVNIVCNGMFTYDEDYQKPDVNNTQSSITNSTSKCNESKVLTIDSQQCLDNSSDKDKISWETLSSSESSDSAKDFTEIGNKADIVSRLQEELRNAQKELKLRDEEITRLSRIRTDVETELEDLTASLFQEAHTMVQQANINQASAENSLKESEMKVEVLTAEVAALKTLVLTSTPSCPNPHLHPQISKNKEDFGGVFTRKHQRSPSHFNLKYGREASPPDSPVKENRTILNLGTQDQLECKEGYEVDPNIHKEFLEWKENPKMDRNDPFISRIYTEDINLCLNFNNKELTIKVQEAVDSGNIFVEAVSDKTKVLFPKKCALLEVSRICSYRMKLGEQDTWHNISQICRNRIIAVCDFLNYLRYIERGLVKNSAHDVYWEMTRLRKEMILARLGLPLTNNL